MAEHPFDGTWRSVITKFTGGGRDKALVNLKIAESGTKLEKGEFVPLIDDGSGVLKPGTPIPLKAESISREEIVLRFDALVPHRLHGFLIPELSSPSLKVVCGLFSLPEELLSAEARKLKLDGQNDGTWTGTNP